MCPVFSWQPAAAQRTIHCLSSPACDSSKSPFAPLGLMPTSSQAKIQDKERCASHNSAQWDARLDELMSSHDCT
eukprot:4681317-Amphidinium_carterae.1